MMRAAFSSTLLFAAAAGLNQVALLRTPSPSTSPAFNFAATGVPRHDVASTPRAVPRPEGKAPADPLNLWGSPSPPSGPQGPSAFQLNRGKAIDTLRRDYPALFESKPDLSIFHSQVDLHDPSGKRLGGVSNYARVFDMLRFLRRTTMADASVTHRITCPGEDDIRIRWQAKLWMRDPATGITKLTNGEDALVHIDGVSVYELDEAGLIVRHRLEDIVLTGSEEAAPAINLAFAWPTAGSSVPELATPFFKVMDSAASAFEATDETKASFRIDVDGGGGGGAPSSGGRRSPAPQASAAHSSAEPGETPMQRAARERAEDAAKAAELAEKRRPKPKKNDGTWTFGGPKPQKCETSYDCDAPQVCCDVLFTKVCCGGGMMIPNLSREAVLQRQAIPIPVEKDDPFPGGQPPGGGGSLPPGYPGGGGGGGGGW